MQSRPGVEALAGSPDRLARRVVEPYRVEWRGNTAYLVGFCHRAEAERVFRLDRIREIEMLALSER